MPSIPGMLMSRKTMSGCRLCTIAIASRPLLASPTIRSSGHASFKRSMICSRIRRSSSATTAEGAAEVNEAAMLAQMQSGWYRGDFVRYFDRGARAARGRDRDDQFGPPVVQSLQPLADVGQPDARFGGRHETDAGVEDMDRQLPIGDLGADLDLPALGFRLQAMLDRVFHQGLQHHRREDGRFQAFRHAHYRL